MMMMMMMMMMMVIMCGAAKTCSKTSRQYSSADCSTFATTQSYNGLQCRHFHDKLQLLTADTFWYCGCFKSRPHLTRQIIAGPVDKLLPVWTSH